MYYTYILKQKDSTHFYIGSTGNIKNRIKQHNSSINKSTAGRTWVIECYFAFRTRELAEQFETYLKSHSGRSFSKKHFHSLS